MKEWFIKFINKHGERVVFLLWATVMGTSFMFIEQLKDSGITILSMITGVILNKARSPENKNKD